MIDRFRVPPGSKVRLKDRDPLDGDTNPDSPEGQAPLAEGRMKVVGAL
jgi:hypothetical protein